MSIGSELLKELTLEASLTRRYLERIPFDQLDFKPSEKSETLGRLAVHVVEIIAWWSSLTYSNRLDFEHFQPKDVKQKSELLTYFDDLLVDAKKALNSIDNEDFSENWSMTHGDDILFTLPKFQVARIFCMNHLIHHRAQLGMYLRLLNISVPASYGPSADDEDVILIHPL